MSLQIRKFTDFHKSHMHFTETTSHFWPAILYFQNFDPKFEMSDFKTINLPLPTKIGCILLMKVATSGPQFCFSKIFISNFKSASLKI